MKTSTNDRIEGTVHVVKGKAKEVAGELIDDPSLTAEGQAEKLVGKIQQKVAQVEEILEP